VSIEQVGVGFMIKEGLLNARKGRLNARGLGGISVSEIYDINIRSQNEYTILLNFVLFFVKHNCGHFPN
jgi:hypothetical protein